MKIRMALPIQMQRNQTHSAKFSTTKSTPTKLMDNNRVIVKLRINSVFCMQASYGRILIFIKPNFLKIEGTT